MSEQPIIIFGTGSYAQVAHVYLHADSPYRIVAYTVHGQYMNAETLDAMPIIPYEDLINHYPPDEFKMLIALGPANMNDNRRSVYEQAKRDGYQFISYVSSKAIQWGEVSIGENTFIFEGNVLQPFVSIGDNTILWSGNHIGHHSTIGSHIFMASHVVVSGHCTVGDHCFLGVNSTIIDHVRVAERTLVGAGALITQNTEPNSAHVGTPARVSSRTSDLFKL